MAIHDFLYDWFERPASRRKFLTRAGQFFSMLSLLKASELDAQDTCATQDITHTESPTGIPDAQVFSWVHAANDFGVSTLALYLHLPQSTKRYVEQVVLSDEGGQILAARYFRPEAQTLKGKLPYMIFDRMLLPAISLFIHVRVIEGDSNLVYRSALTGKQLQRSQFTSKALPQRLLDNFSKPFANEISSTFTNAKSLLTSTSCQSSKGADVCFPEHRVTAAFTKFGADFELTVSFQHPEETNHYMRFFFLCDPVGRLLGLKHREPKEAPLNQVVIKPISTQDMNTWGILSDSVAQLTDCPYVMLFWEDNKHAFREQIVCLR